MEETLLVRHLTERPVDGMRLGRHQEHDERSRAFAVPAGCLPVAGAASSVRWIRRAPVLNQGSIGSCTGNAMAGVIGTDGAHRRGDASVSEDLALVLYERATRIDRIAGSYPPDDTGSSGLAVAKAALQLGYLKAYKHAFSWKQVVAALADGPAITGIAWREGCDSPDHTGLVSYSGAVRGGHEIELVGLDQVKHVVWFMNSWGPGWGLEGAFCMTFTDYRKALADGGDVTVPVWA